MISLALATCISCEVIMKKLLSLVLACVIFISLPVAAFASSEVTTSSTPEYVINPSGQKSLTTIQDIDRLMAKKNNALYHEDYETANEVQEQLYALGARPSTPEEIASLSEDGLMNTTDILSAAGSFETVYSEVELGNTTYQIRRIYYTPTEYSNLYNGGSVAKKNTVNIQARFCDALSVGINTGLGFVPEVGTVLSLFDFLGGLSDAISGTTVIQDINADYDYNVMEYPVFLAYKAGSIWTGFAASSYANVDIVLTIFDVIWKDGKYEPELGATKYEAEIYPDYYNNGPYLLNYFFNHSYLFVRAALLESIHVYNGDQDFVFSIPLVAPDNPDEVT